MAYTYTFPNTEINFTNLVNTPSSGKFGTKHCQKNDFQYAQEDGIKPFINAVEIDWNGAKLGDTIIKMIGESTLFNSCSA